MSSNIREMIERSAARAQRVSQVPHVFFVARVVSYDPKNDAIRVNFDHVDDNSQEPHWVPIMRPWVGNNYGMQAGPEAGAIALIATVHWEGSDLVCIGWYYNDNAQSLQTPSKEYWLVDSRGNSVKLTQSNGLQLNSTNAQLGNVSSISGNPNRILREKDLYPLISALNSHQHTGVTTGAGTSGAPSSSFSNPSGSTSAKAGD